MQQISGERLQDHWSSGSIFLFLNWFYQIYAFNLFNALLQLKRLCPDSEAEFYIQAGIDKEGFEVKYISDYKGISATRENKHCGF